MVLQRVSHNGHHTTLGNACFQLRAALRVQHHVLLCIKGSLVFPFQKPFQLPDARLHSSSSFIKHMQGANLLLVTTADLQTYSHVVPAFLQLHCTPLVHTVVSFVYSAVRGLTGQMWKLVFGYTSVTPPVLIRLLFTGMPLSPPPASKFAE